MTLLVLHNSLAIEFHNYTLAVSLYYFLFCFFASQFKFGCFNFAVIIFGYIFINTSWALTIPGHGKTGPMPKKCKVIRKHYNKDLITSFSLKYHILGLPAFFDHIASHNQFNSPERNGHKCTIFVDEYHKNSKYLVSLEPVLLYNFSLCCSASDT